MNVFIAVSLKETSIEAVEKFRSYGVARGAIVRYHDLPTVILWTARDDYFATKQTEILELNHIDYGVGHNVMELSGFIESFMS